MLGILKVQLALPVNGYVLARKGEETTPAGWDLRLSLMGGLSRGPSACR